MAAQVQRRELHFESIDDALAESQRLIDAGYQSLGSWTLGQTCFHLAEWARFPMDGFPTPPWFIRSMFGVFKMLGMVEKMKQGILTDGFKPGTPTAPQTVPAADAMDDVQGLQQFSQVVERMKSFDGQLQVSPLFGEMDRDTWFRVTILHAQHHLGFLEPNANSEN